MEGQAALCKLNHCVYALRYHLILVTEHRRKCITTAMLDRLREIAAARCEGWGSKLAEVNGEPAHVHLLLALPPNLDLSRFVNNLKTTSSRLIRKEFAAEVNRVYRKPVFWSRSYRVISYGGALRSIIKQHVEQQAAPE